MSKSKDIFLEQMEREYQEERRNYNSEFLLGVEVSKDRFTGPAKKVLYSEPVATLAATGGNTNQQLMRNYEMVHSFDEDFLVCTNCEDHDACRDFGLCFDLELGNSINKQP